ncbi:NBR1-Ig-like domain-containing protein [Nonomuraea sp. NPDC046802]|uniref:NBR1-Ig-like domain-containing protein n=1 Tax=Nonomuraea sp. NPDC046802 TaxID=3154919 RepID=UPI003404CBD0
METQAPRKRRGRQLTRPDPGSGPTGAFADKLVQLKQAAGDPSYAEMASRLGAAASKSSLASAAQGRKFPTWGTTWEYVRVLAVDRLGGDPKKTRQEWRDLWERARADSSLAGMGTVDGTQDEAPPHDAGTDPALPPRPAQRSRLLFYVVAAATIAVAGAVLFTPATKALRNNPPPSGPMMSPAPLDNSEFVADVTYPDGSKVRPGSSFKKVWRIHNAGTVAWEGRFLARVNKSPCRSPEKVTIPSTAPGQTVDIAVRVKAPDSPGNCRVYWKMTDAQGRVLFPLKRGVFLDVQVGPS